MLFKREIKAISVKPKIALLLLLVNFPLNKTDAFQVFHRGEDSLETEQSMV